jgi:hypothetical protein
MMGFGTHDFCMASGSWLQSEQARRRMVEPNPAPLTSR